MLQGLTGFFASWITSGLWGEFEDASALRVLTLALLCVRGALPIAHILHFFALFPQLDPIATFPRSVKVSPNGNPIFIDDSLSVREE